MFNYLLKTMQESSLILHRPSLVSTPFFSPPRNVIAECRKVRISGLLVVVPNGLETPYFSVTGVAEKGVTA